MSSKCHFPPCYYAGEEHRDRRESGMASSSIGSFTPFEIKFSHYGITYFYVVRYDLFKHVKPIQLEHTRVSVEQFVEPLNVKKTKLD